MKRAQPDIPTLLLRSVTVRRSREAPTGFPYNLPVIRSLEALEFSSPVTFFVGENGSGKSTLLEAIAAAAGSITVGSEGADRDKTLAPVRALAKDLKLVWSKKTRRGFFMRSEDFFGFAKKMASTREELQANLEEVDRDYKDRSVTAQMYARAAYMRELAAMRNSYGEDLDAHSHGESYLTLFQARFVPDGLYLLDEPEAPLSPKRQLAFLALLKRMVDQRAQFIIATHSPIIMAFPGAVILNFDRGRIEPVAYEKVEHVYVTRTFLAGPERYLRHLFEEQD